MTKDPSLHIKRSDLYKIMADMLPKGVDYNNFVDVLLVKCAPLSISTRSVISSTIKSEKKFDRIQGSSRFDADLVAKLLHATRVRLKHKGVTQIKPSSKDWEMVKDLTKNIIDFCIDFNLPKREGAIAYLEIGLNKMNKYGLNKFSNLYESICDTYAAKLEIDQDSEPDITLQLYKIYSSNIMDQTGIFEDFKKEPEKYVWFVRARLQAKQLNMGLEEYIEAQFEGLDFARGIPHPSQLVGPKATERISRYLYKYNLKVDNNRTK